MKKYLMLPLALVLTLACTVCAASAAGREAGAEDRDGTEAHGAELLSTEKWTPTGTLEQQGKAGDNLTWKLYSDKTLAVSGEGAIPDYGTAKEQLPPWYDYRAGIKRIVIEDGVTSVGSYAFWNFPDLCELVIADTVKTTAHAAFHKCTALTAVVIPDGLETLGSSTFDYCTALSSVTLGSVRTIDTQVFKNCPSLTSITIPDSVTKLDGGAFYGCSALKNISIGDTSHFSLIDGVLFSKDGETLIAYPGGKGTTYAVPSGTVNIAVNAFYGRKEVTSVTLPNGLQTIGDAAFMESGITSIRLPDGLQTIGGSAFRNCVGITDIHIPASVTGIGKWSFWGCSSLKEILVDSSSSSYCTVDGVVFTKDMSTLCFYPGGKPDSVYTVPSGVSFIANDSCMSSGNLTSVIFPEGIKEIRYQSFWGCGKLESITLPSTLTKVQRWTFLYCNALKDVFYHGSREQWDSLDIDPAYNGPLLNATKHYAQIKAGSVTANPEDTVEIPISLELNPGVTVMRLQVSYDKDALALEGVTDKEQLGSAAHSNDYSANPYTLFWNNHTAKANIMANGTVTVLRFKIASGAKDGAYPIRLFYDSAANDILNKDLNPVGFDITNGSVTVTHIRYGDVNEDRRVTPQDSAILDRYLANWTGFENINKENADVDMEPSVTPKDSAVLARYLASWKGYDTLPCQFSAASLADAALQDAAAGVIRAGTAKAAPGETVTVPISLADNPGVAMMRLQIAYDSEALELAEVRDAGILGAEVHSDDYSRNPYTLFWNNGTAKQNYTANGTIASLIFRVKDTAQGGEYPVTVSYDAESGDILDWNLRSASFQVQNGIVSVLSDSYTPSVVSLLKDTGTGGANRITATVSCPESGAVVWCSFYQQSGQWAGALSKDVAPGQMDYAFSTDIPFDSVKIFVLDAALRPLCVRTEAES